MQMNLSEAARRANVDRSTIVRKVRQGLISTSKDINGNPQVDLSELARVYPQCVQSPQEHTTRPLVQPTGAIQNETTDKRLVDILERQIVSCERTIEDQRKQLERMEQRLDRVLNGLDVTKELTNRAGTTKKQKMLARVRDAVIG